MGLAPSERYLLPKMFTTQSTDILIQFRCGRIAAVQTSCRDKPAVTLARDNSAAGTHYSGMFFIAGGKQQENSGELQPGARFSSRDFELSPLHLFLALNAEARPGHGFEALGINLFAAGNALPEVAFANAAQRAFNHLEQLAIVIALVEEEFFVVRTGSAIRNVSRGGIYIGFATILRSAVQSAA